MHAQLSAKPFVISNWKMNGTKALLSEALPIWQDAASKEHWIFCPPTTLLSEAKSSFPDVQLGGQDCSAKPSGAFTSQISAAQLADVGASYVILGHSECRQHRGDTNADVAAKAIAALAAGLTPIICIGESEAVYNASETLAFLEKQLTESTAGVTGLFMLAYEPIWAIGTGKTATTADIEHVHQFLRSKLTDINSPNTKLLYGGSVNAQNANAIVDCKDVDGLLVGGVSLKVDEFKQLLLSVYA
jgi:triosephosphate isomerase